MSKTRNLSKVLALVIMLALVIGILPMGVMANPVATQVGTTGVYFCFGSPAKPDTFPENGMSLSYNSSTGAYDVVYSNSSYYPTELSIYVYDVDSSSNSVSLTTANSSAVHFEIYDIDGNATTLSTINYNTNNNYSADAGAYQKSNLFAVKIAAAGDVTVKKGSNTAFTLHFSDPVSNGTSPGMNPKTVNGYLPIGQFATGSGWGSAYANGNQYGTTYGTTYKFVGGLNSTGVSLGMLGGYVQFELSDANMIKNDADNPYGVDFIVYGNAFSGNPEAAMVMVSENGETWYNLAGSRHYQAGTTKSMNISYIKIGTANTTISSGSYSSTFASKGIYYSTDYVPGNYTTAADANLAIAKATWSGIPSANGPTNPGVAFWPEYGSGTTTAEGYNRVWNDGKVDATASGAAADATGKVYWNRLGSAEVISYCGVSRVPDDYAATGANSTDYYRFGYADVRANGSNYGTAVNPYETLPSALAGGDGFDLSWAVNSNGEPVIVNNVHYVRVYSAVLYNAGIFGETSAEVCGLYVANGSGSGAASIAPTVKINGSTISTTNGGVSAKRLYSGATATINVTSSADYIYINGELVSSGENYVLSIASGNTYYVQIITQDGTESPYLTVLKITR